MKSAIIHFLLIISLFGCREEYIELTIENNYFKGLQKAVETDKPIFLHFTCYGCMGYNEFVMDFMKSHRIMKTLDENFIVMELYVDDKDPFTEIDTVGMSQLIKSTKGRELLKKSKSKGEVNAIIESELFNLVSQPVYVVLNEGGQPLMSPISYCRRNEKKFLRHLEIGLRNFQKNKKRKPA